MNPNDEPARTAYHEAGHFIVAHALGMKPRRVTIARRGESLGRVHCAPGYATDGSSAEGDDERMEHDAIYSLAGYLAEKRFSESADVEMARHDLEHAGELAERLSGSAAEVERRYNALMARAAEAVEKNWPQIEKVAGALLERRTLSRKDVLALLG